MKTKSRSSRIKARAQVSHKRAVRRRPLHKRVLLHPISWFLLLCVGVLVAGSTFRGEAVTYDVTATVPAAPLTQPAVITAPTDQFHSTVSLVDVLGTCPDSSYVKLFRDGVFVGVSVCSSGSFQIQTSLSPGANQMSAQVFNLTDTAGPASSPITVFYDLPPPPALVPPPAASLPTTLTDVYVEQQPQETGTVAEVTSRPTISGLAPPFSDVVVTFHSDPSVCTTKADRQGVWTCTLPESLAPGLHHVTIVATTPSGKHLELPAFQVRVVQYAQPFVVTSNYAYAAHAEGQAVNWTLAITGGTAPFTLDIDWGDGQKSQVVRPDRSEFTISHAFAVSSADGRYAVVITATDGRDATSVLQLAAVIKSSVVTVGATNNLLGGLSEMIRHWLWVVWPAYIAVVLMAISFWIGERDAYQHFMERRRMRRQLPHGRGR